MAQVVGQLPISSLRDTVHQAAATLNAIHAHAESRQWSDAETTIMQLFQQLKSLDAQVAQLAETASAEPSMLAKNQKSLSALLVDDNENETRLLSSYLRVKGFDVSVASDGRQAMDSLQESQPDVVLLDMNMPEFDGPWTIQQIRRDEQLDDLPVFAVSGTEPIDANVEIGPHGVDEWFRKPLNPESLVSAIVKQVDDSDADDLPTVPFGPQSVT